MLTVPLLAVSDRSVEKIVSRIKAHLTLEDVAAARCEVEQGMQLFPQSDLLLAIHIRTLARLGDEKEMIKAWNNYVLQFPEQKLDRELIEEMAWGVLNRASRSSSLVMRQMALLAALFSDDAKGVKILYRGLQDPNYAIRAVAVTLSGDFRDTKLIRQMQQLYQDEKNWAVRQKVIEAIGSMQIIELRTELERVIASDTSFAEEKAAAIKSLIQLLDQVERNEILRLVRSDRSGLRLLACKAIAYFQSERDLDQLLLLTQDNQADVRLAAFQTIGQLKPTKDTQTIIKSASRGCGDTNYKVCITAAWLLTLYQPSEGMRQISWHIHAERREQRLLAAAALKATGSFGAPLSLQLYETHPDPYVRLNLALGLAGQQLAIHGVCRVLEQTLAIEDKWSEMEQGLFNAIVSRHLIKEVDTDSDLEMGDQLLRLKILNKLAILQSPHAQAAARQFLVERSWGITSMAAALLLTEGDENSIALVQELLNDSQSKVRLQAALVLSLWSHEEAPIKVLEESFFVAEREQKCRILEGLGRIGSMKSVPFLLQVLNEPSQTLRLIAAMALIQCLNH